MAAGRRANEEQPDHCGNGHEKRMPVQNVLEIHRATGYSASMRHLERLAEKIERDPSLGQRFEKQKCGWSGTF
jgi:hypothetical protein